MDRCKEILAQNNVTRRFQLYKLFSVNDTDSSYTLSKNEMKKLFSEQLKTELTDDELDTIFKAIDTNGDGDVSFTEWVAVLFPEM